MSRAAPGRSASATRDASGRSRVRGFALWRLAPSFLLVGAQKSGTTSLFRYLLGHPGVAPPRRKSIHYFNVLYENGPRWYSRRFPVALTPAQRARVTGEACPEYLFHAHAAARAHALLPHARIIAVLREPVERAWSHYRHVVRKGRESWEFDRAVREEETRIGAELRREREEPAYSSESAQRHSYVSRGHYAEQLARWLAVYPRAQVLVINAGVLFERPAEAWERVRTFLGLGDWSPPEFEVHNLGSRVEKGGMDAATRAWLTDHFRAHNRALFDMIGEDWGWPT